jgi:class 3 adenylate cyclase/pimeloyl-ACP methyl ester carboxylesterase
MRRSDEGHELRRDVTGVPETRWARTVDGACIAYQEFGEGPVTLVFVYGWLSHVEIVWECAQWARQLTRMAKHMRVLHFDKRGVGMSDRLGSAPSLDVQMDDIRAVMDAAEVERATLCAEGWISPALAAVFAATHPDRTEALWLDGPVHYAQEEDYPWGESEETWQEWVNTFCPTWGTLTNIVPLAHDYIGDHPDNEALYRDPSFQSWLARWSRYAATPNSVEQLGSMWRAIDIRPILSTICVPTAVIVPPGIDQDEVDAMEYVAAHIPASRRIEFDRGLLPDPRYMERYVAALEAFIASAREEEAQLDRALATVLFTDIVGSTDRACEMGDAAWTELLERHHQVTRALIARYRGSKVKSTGDGVLATFDGPARAVKCAQAICEAVKPLGLEVRAGCHTGEVELLGTAAGPGAEGGDDVGGIAAHIGARVAALAGPSEVLVSSTVKDLVAGSGLVFEERGEHQLKGVPEKWRLYAVAS